MPGEVGCAGSAGLVKNVGDVDLGSLAGGGCVPQDLGGGVGVEVPLVEQKIIRMHGDKVVICQHIGREVAEVAVTMAWASASTAAAMTCRSSGSGKSKESRSGSHPVTNASSKKRRIALMRS